MLHCYRPILWSQSDTGNEQITLMWQQGDTDNSFYIGGMDKVQMPERARQNMSDHNKTRQNKQDALTPSMT
jgi:hypothetical protein